MQHLNRVDHPGVLKHSVPLSLHQSWLPEPEPGFQSGEVRVGWSPDSLHVHARLEDRDIFNPETRFNEPAFFHGDVFEIFVQPPEGEAYYEFHVGPENQVFQLRIPSPEAFLATRDQGIQKEWQIPERKFHSQVLLGEGIWEILAEIPTEALELPQLRPQDVCKMSFCRYDANRNPDSTIISSTSPLKEPDFHRIHEWIEFLVQ